jgi:hypothetical protein
MRDAHLAGDDDLRDLIGVAAGDRELDPPPRFLGWRKLRVRGQRQRIHCTIVVHVRATRTAYKAFFASGP